MANTVAIYTTLLTALETYKDSLINPYTNVLDINTLRICFEQEPSKVVVK